MSGIIEHLHLAKFKVVGLWMWHVQRDSIQADKGVCDYFSVPAADGEQGVPLSNFLNGVYSEDRPRVTRRIARAVMTGKPFHEVYRVVHRTDGIRWIEAKGTCFRDGEGRPATYPGTIVDVTDVADEHPHALVVERLMEAHQLAEDAKEAMLARLIQAVLLEAGRRLASTLSAPESEPG
jgi:PAS domain-containing protein